MTAFDPQAFWAKATLFLNRAMEPGDMRSEDERRLWASLALEQLAKWALAETSPVLVADPVIGDGGQLLRALGLRESVGSVTVGASTAFKRCEVIYRPFSAKDATKFSEARNEHLHGPEIALIGIPAEAWWMRFWSLVDILLSAHGQSPIDLVGSARSAEVEEHISRSAKAIEKRAEALVAGAQRNLKRYDDGLMSGTEQKRWDRVTKAPMGVGLKYNAEATCPACEATGYIEGDYPESEEYQSPEDYDESPSLEVEFYADYFMCPNCHLVLETAELVVAGGIDGLFTVYTEAPEYYEPEYGND
ncbi:MULTISPECIES: hypothetical protein [unclassified Isoptericola]|uniref:hypothetical protein n=1 Tax=unclassified Isoptericola TaxID=2623355 RepID=UPI00365DC367